jgi:hypothetical protein
MRFTEGTRSAGYLPLGKLLQQLLLWSAPLMPINALAQTSIVSGPSSSCPTISGQGPVDHWTQLAGIAAVDYLQYGYHYIDITSFDAIFDYSVLAPNPWPGIYGLDAGIHLPLSSYVSASFIIPPIFDMPSLHGQYSIGNLHFSAPVSMSISYACGDFGQLSPTTVVPHCLVNSATAGDSLLWQGAPNDQVCVLQPNYRYYLNLINADISQMPSTGVAVSTANSACIGACLDPIINGPGNWGVADDIFYSEFE